MITHLSKAKRKVEFLRAFLKYMIHQNFVCLTPACLPSDPVPLGVHVAPKITQMDWLCACLIYRTVVPKIIFMVILLSFFESFLLSMD